MAHGYFLSFFFGLIVTSSSLITCLLCTTRFEDVQVNQTLTCRPRGLTGPGQGHISKTRLLITQRAQTARSQAVPNGCGTPRYILLAHCREWITTNRQMQEQVQAAIAPKRQKRDLLVRASLQASQNAFDKRSAAEAGQVNKQGTFLSIDSGTVSRFDLQSMD